MLSHVVDSGAMSMHVQASHYIIKILHFWTLAGFKFSDFPQIRQIKNFVKVSSYTVLWIAFYKRTYQNAL